MGELNYEQAAKDVHAILAQHGFEQLNDVLGFLEIIKLDIYTNAVIAPRVASKVTDVEAKVS